MKYNVGVMIFRRDLRLSDNTAFIHAMKECNTVIPIFVFTKEQVTNNSYKSNPSVQFMIESLISLNEQLEERNGHLHTFYGENNAVIRDVIRRGDVDAVYVNEDYTLYSKKRDAAIEAICGSMDVAFHSYPDVCLFQPGTILTQGGTTYLKYTPFYENCLARLKMFSLHSIRKYSQGWFKPLNDTKHAITLKEAYVHFTEPRLTNAVTGGRKGAEDILRKLETWQNYGVERNMLPIPTTHLSAYLKYGCVSVREVANKCMKLFGKKHDLIRQLIWRDFYIHILDAFPQVMKGKSLKPKYDNIVWDNNIKWLNAWKKGKTGFPIVDACMRQLNETGYMHNRGRLIVASFLVKTLLIDWRRGEKYFAQNLVDYDPAANNGNWQWIAGSGADSQPYFRIFNPWSQSRKHDPNAEYIKRWCPELESVSPRDIHQWYEYYDRNTDVKYPRPIVDYSEQREKALALYKKYV